MIHEVHKDKNNLYDELDSSRIHSILSYKITFL